jgi:hypothetical protein
MITTHSPWISAADTAKLVRQALKAAYSGVKFSVRSQTYAGGGSIDVAWTDGPTEDSVTSVVRRFAGSSFDPMTDSRSYHIIETPDGPAMSGANYVFTRRTLSDKFIAELAIQCVADLWDEEIAGQRCGTYPNGRGGGAGCGGVFPDNTAFIHPLAVMMSGYGEPLACSPSCAARFYGHQLPRVAVSQELIELATTILDRVSGSRNELIAEVYSGRLPLELPDGPAREVAVVLAPEWRGSLFDLFAAAKACTA